MIQHLLACPEPVVLFMENVVMIAVTPSRQQTCSHLLFYPFPLPPLPHLPLPQWVSREGLVSSSMMCAATNDELQNGVGFMCIGWREEGVLGVSMSDGSRHCAGNSGALK